MINAADRFARTRNRIGASRTGPSVQLSCSSCRRVRDVTPGDEVATTGFCKVCIDSAGGDS